MAEHARRRLSVHLPWSTLVKVLAALALIYLWHELVWIVLLVTLALVIAAGLLPVAQWLEARAWPRWLAATAIVLVIVGSVIGFFAVTWSSLSAQSSNLGSQLQTLERDLLQRAPQPLVDMLKQSASGDNASLGPFVVRVGRNALYAVGAFVVAWILVLYLLIERDETYAWVRGFVPAAKRARLDRTAMDAREVATGFVVGNFATSTCAAIYFFAWLTVLGVPGALLLALLAFLFDFIPVLGFYLSCAPAIAMAATQSSALALAMIPVYLSYDFIENYLIGPRIYGNRLRLSKLAVLLAFAVGAQLAGVLGALLALPLAAIYPTVERLWLRRTFGDDVVQAHEETGNPG